MIERKNGRVVSNKDNENPLLMRANGVLDKYENGPCRQSAKFDAVKLIRGVQEHYAEEMIKHAARDVEASTKTAEKLEEWSEALNKAQAEDDWSRLGRMMLEQGMEISRSANGNEKKKTKGLCIMNLGLSISR